MYESVIKDIDYKQKLFGRYGLVARGLPGYPKVSLLLFFLPGPVVSVFPRIFG